jgi:hypothetical protein
MFSYADNSAIDSDVSGQIDEPNHEIDVTVPNGVL